MPQITLKEVVRLKDNILPVTSKTGNMLWTDVRYTTSNVYTSSKNTKRILFFVRLLEKRIQKFLADYTWVYGIASDIVIPKNGVDRNVHRLESGLGIADYKINVRTTDEWSITTSNYVYSLGSLGASFPYNLQITIDGVLQDYVGINTQPELDAYFADLLFTKNSNTNYSITNTEIIYGDLVITDRSFDNSFDNSFG